MNTYTLSPTIAVPADASHDKQLILEALGDTFVPVSALTSITGLTEVSPVINFSAASDSDAKGHAQAILEAIEFYYPTAAHPLEATLTGGTLTDGGALIQV